MKFKRWQDVPVGSIINVDGITYRVKQKDKLRGLLVSWSAGHRVIACFWCPGQRHLDFVTPANEFEEIEE